MPDQPNSTAQKLRKHVQDGLEHSQMPDPTGECLICRLEAVAEAWFSFDQQALDALLGEYRTDGEAELAHKLISDFGRWWSS